jgi:ABC-type glycerol-3-phosphate transport system substrate-binding protein
VTSSSILLYKPDSSDSTRTEPITLTVFASDSGPQWDNMESPVGQKIKEETGVTLQPEFDVNGGQQKIPLMFAGGEYPDMILPKGGALEMAFVEGASVEQTSQGTKVTPKLDVSSITINL